VSADVPFIWSAEPEAELPADVDPLDAGRREPLELDV
jgi:hypothetical protein